MFTVILSLGVVKAIAANTVLYPDSPFPLNLLAQHQLFLPTKPNSFQATDEARTIVTLPQPAVVSRVITSPQFIPRQEIVLIHPTNYEPRMARDLNGNPIHNEMIVVLHETVGSARSAINTFRNAHPNDSDQVSYHSLIQRDGTILYLVPPEMRAFGAGNSVFNGPNGAETVRLDPILPASVNNFAYHTSLESPPDGQGNGRTHSGYTNAQYQSLAWLIAQSTIPDIRITTHQAVDRSGTRHDPRSFDRQRFLTLLHGFREAA